MNIIIKCKNISNLSVAAFKISVSEKIIKKKDKFVSLNLVLHLKLVYTKGVCLK